MGQKFNKFVEVVNGKAFSLCDIGIIVGGIALAGEALYALYRWKVDTKESFERGRICGKCEMLKDQCEAKLAELDKEKINETEEKEEKEA